MADRIYCYPGSCVLKNKLGIRDPEQLHKMEKRLTMLRILELLDKPMEGAFDLKHLKSIHKHIFQDIYPWAGQIRKVDIAKGTMFCNVRFIESQAEEIFGRLREEGFLRNLPEQLFIRRLAFHFSEINALHPFREGNGRSQREFIRCLALRNGYVLNFTNTARNEMLEASKASFLCDYEKIEQVFAKCLRKR